MKSKKLLQATLITFALISSGVHATGSKQPPPEQQKVVTISVNWYDYILNLF